MVVVKASEKGRKSAAAAEKQEVCSGHEVLSRAAARSGQGMYVSELLICYAISPWMIRDS